MLRLRKGKNMKVVINCDFGGFGLSDEASRLYLTKKRIGWTEEKTGFMSLTNFKIGSNSDDYFWDHQLERNDPVLIEVIEELGKKANGKYANLKIVEIPNDVEWQVEEYDGMEHIAEKHRTWC